ncbi:MAG: threonine ammonia-lyase IlvA [Hyphomicrobiales bacterium]|nr:threonine ammonia-lyase IlvA [Hyphomicrobiales bacterium]
MADETHRQLLKFIVATPLQFNRYLSDLHNANIWLKREDLSPVRSYKLRGAYAFFNEAVAVGDNAEFVCASAGNHAQGFAHACRHFGKNGWIFMPVTTPAQKIEKTRSFGGEQVDIRLIGDTFDECNREALKFCRQRDAMFVPPFDHPQIILGQASVAAEIIAQFPEGVNIDRLVLPIGGGGLAAGLAAYFGKQMPDEAFVFVEPDGAPSFHSSLEKGERVVLTDMDSFVDGAAVGQIGEQTFSRLKHFSADQVVLAPTNGVCETMIEMLNIEGVVLEPAGALSIDALKRLPSQKVKGANIVCVVSGGNFDFERLPEVKERALKFAGLKKYFILQMPQRPGALKDFLLMLGPDDDIARFEYLKKSARNFGSVLIGIETGAPENFEELTLKLDEAGLRYQDITENEIVANLVI